MASQASGRPFETAHGRGSISIEVVSQGLRGLLRSRKATWRLFVHTSRIVHLEQITLMTILMRADTSRNPDIGITRHTVEREVVTTAGDHIVIKVSVWLNGVTDSKVASWVAGVMDLTLQEPGVVALLKKSPKADDTLDLNVPRGEQVLCGGIVADPEPLTDSERRDS